MNKHLQASRYPNRVSQDQQLIKEILDESRFCTVAYYHDNKVHQIPTGFCLVDDQIYIHGSTKSHFINQILKAKSVNIATMLFDGLVLSPTALDHSVNYRSVIIYGQATEISDLEEKKEILSAFTDRYIPGRMTEVSPPNEKELKATRVVGFSIKEASCKIRNGPVGVDTSKTEVWSGIIPATICYSIPEQDEGQSGAISIPDYITKFVVKSNAK